MAKRQPDTPYSDSKAKLYAAKRLKTHLFNTMTELELDEMIACLMAELAVA